MHSLAVVQNYQQPQQSISWDSLGKVLNNQFKLFQRFGFLIKDFFLSYTPKNKSLKDLGPDSLGAGKCCSILCQKNCFSDKKVILHNPVTFPWGFTTNRLTNLYFTQVIVWFTIYWSLKPVNRQTNPAQAITFGAPSTLTSSRLWGFSTLQKTSFLWVGWRVRQTIFHLTKSLFFVSFPLLKKTYASRFSSLPYLWC